MDHDVFTCECHETCSICAVPHRITQLKPHTFVVGGVKDTWEHVCPTCRQAG